MLHTHGTIVRELLVLIYQQETEEKQQQKGQGPTCQGPQEFFARFSGNNQVRKLQLARVEGALI